jgi:hypothetical protein
MVRAGADVEATPRQCIEEYIYHSSVGRDDDTPATWRSPPKVATSAPQRTRQTTGKMSASWAAALIVAT